MTDLERVLHNLATVRILVVGDYMLDQYLSGTVSRISPEAPVPVVQVREKKLKMGGAGNVARNIVALGGHVRALADIGADTGGGLLISELKGNDVETGFIVQNPNRTTSLKTRIVAQNQQMLRYDEETIMPVDHSFLEMLQEKCEAIFERVNAVILSDYGKGVLTPEVSQFVIREAKKRHLPVFVDPKGANYRKYCGADYCTPNMMELREASGITELGEEEDICNAARIVCEKSGVKNLLVTRSEKGISLVSGTTGKKTDFPAITKEVIDVTGAGDTVISIFSMGIASGASPDLCCRLANLAASVVISKFGAATASVREIETLLRDETRTAVRKIYSAEEMRDIADMLRGKERRIVFTNGCFDLVHAGHIASFKKAKAMGDILVVGVNSDKSVRRLKGKSRPVVDLPNRLSLLEAIDVIDYVIPFDEDTPQLLIESIRPDVLVKGRDWEGKKVAGSDFIESYGGKVAFVDLEEGLSTTALVAKIRGSAQ